MKTARTHIVPPAGMTGLAVEPWSHGEVYAVAADWSQASCPVRTYGSRGWEYDRAGRQVADFRHDPREALEDEILYAIQMSGDEPDDEQVAAIMAAAWEIG